MDKRVLSPGLIFSSKKKITIKECETIVPFLEQDHTADSASLALGSKKTEVYGLIRRLVLKRILRVKSKDERGNLVYEFNQKAMDEE